MAAAIGVSLVVLIFLLCGALLLAACGAWTINNERGADDDEA